MTSLRRSPDLQRHKTIFETVQALRAPHPRHDTGWLTVIDISLGESLPDSDPGVAAGGVTPQFYNSWQNVDNTGVTLPRLAFYLSPDGEVRMRGHIRGGAVGTYCTILPVHFRPVSNHTFLVPNDAGGFSTVEIQAAGYVYIQNIVLVQT